MSNPRIPASPANMSTDSVQRHETPHTDSIDLPNLDRLADVDTTTRDQVVTTAKATLDLTSPSNIANSARRFVSNVSAISDSLNTGEATALKAATVLFDMLTHAANSRSAASTEPKDVEAESFPDILKWMKDDSDKGIG